jgi:flagellar motor protein MotB
MKSSGTSGHLAATFTDLMTSLMVIFILLFVANLNNAAGARTLIQRKILAELRDALGGAGVTQARIIPDPKDPYAIVVILPDSSLFARGKWDLLPEGEERIRGLIPRLADVVCKAENRNVIESLVVEGHTDSTYVTGRESTDEARDYNMVLSQKRSMDVLRASLSPLKGQVRDCVRSVMSASGRGQEELLREPGLSGASDRQRRVVFKIRVKDEVAQQLAAGQKAAVVP